MVGWRLEKKTNGVVESSVRIWTVGLKEDDEKWRDSEKGFFKFVLGENIFGLLYFFI